MHAFDRASEREKEEGCREKQNTFYVATTRDGWMDGKPTTRYGY